MSRLILLVSCWVNLPQLWLGTTIYGYPPSNLFMLFAHLGLGHRDSQCRRGYSVFAIAVGEADSLCRHSPNDYGLKRGTLPCCGQLGLNVCFLGKSHKLVHPSGWDLQAQLRHSFVATTSSIQQSQKLCKIE